MVIIRGVIAIDGCWEKLRNVGIGGLRTVFVQSYLLWAVISGF